MANPINDKTRKMCLGEVKKKESIKSDYSQPPLTPKAFWRVGCNHTFAGFWIRDIDPELRSIFIFQFSPSQQRDLQYFYLSLIIETDKRRQRGEGEEEEEERASNLPDGGKKTDGSPKSSREPVAEEKFHIAS
ncbi:unnamed protein product [Dovyalis caffra]|uniref:Uncharacterized protein n=1 Tax=Dovyalis caffra TaxID=77055 RepID=A0AAV1S7C7_9ROSI|nr:unnamed protein product [Dovyalis caffra]